MRDIVITSSILIIVVLTIRFLARGRLKPALQYALWLPVVLRLILPLPLWKSPFSILNYIPQEMAVSEWGEADTAYMEPVSDPMTEPVLQGEEITDGVLYSDMDREAHGNHEQAGPVSWKTIEKTLNGTYLQDFHLGGILPYIWAAGMLLVGGYMFFYQMKWKSYLKKNRKLCKNIGEGGKYRGKLPVYTVKGLPSPCLFGRSIYLMTDMTLDEKKLEHILAHEYCHYKQLDFVWVIVRCVLCVVYWFHPLVWIAAGISKQDSELSCDEAAVRLLGEKERISYGTTLLQLVAFQGTYDKGKAGIASTMSGKESGIRERIIRIVGKRSYIAAVSVASVLFVAVFIAITFSGTVQGKTIGSDKNAANAGNERTLSDMPADGEMQDILQEENEMQDLLSKQSDVQNGMEEIRSEKEEKADAERKARTEAVLMKLDSYDADIDVFGSGEGVYGFRDAKMPSDYVQAYFDNGGDALDEGMYLLHTRKGPDGSDIKIYGMYTKEFGCEGITILIADDSAKFDIPWDISYGSLLGREEYLQVYESAEDGMPRTFAFMIPVSMYDRREVYNCYLCDRYDTGTIELKEITPETYLSQIDERITYEIMEEESRIDVYDNGSMIGSITVPASAEAMEKIGEVVVDGKIVYWDLGQNIEELRINVAVGLKLRSDSGEEQIWYHGMAPLSFGVRCGSFGDRSFVLERPAIETEYEIKTNVLKTEPKTLDEFLSNAS